MCRYAPPSSSILRTLSNHPRRNTIHIRFQRFRPSIPLSLRTFVRPRVHRPIRRVRQPKKNRTSAGRSQITHQRIDADSAATTIRRAARRRVYRITRARRGTYDIYLYVADTRTRYCRTRKRLTDRRGRRHRPLPVLWRSCAITISFVARGRADSGGAATACSSAPAPARHSAAALRHARDFGPVTHRRCLRRVLPRTPWARRPPPPPTTTTT